MKNRAFLKIIGLLAVNIILANATLAQEMLTGLGENSLIRKLYQEKRPQTKSSIAALRLPFVEDFSNYTGYPDPKLWKDKTAFVNNSYPINPPTIGVATLDAIGADGKIYPHASASTFPADTLTSQCIRLDTNFSLNRKMNVGDSLYFSFYYQPGGGSLSDKEWERIGNGPERNDKLILEFGYETGDTIFKRYRYCDYVLDVTYRLGDTLFNPFIPNLYYIFPITMFPNDVVQLPCDSILGPEIVWNQIWSTEGVALSSWLAANPREYFKLVMIPVNDAQYLRNNFQFRFRNYASLDVIDNAVWKGNVDQWHIDYVRLDLNRSQNDIYPNDIAFVEPSTSLLKTYKAMPWTHFRQSDLATQFNNKLANLSNSTKLANYSYSIAKNGVDIAPYGIYPAVSANSEPYHTHGFDTETNRTEPKIASQFSIPSDSRDSALITITHIFQVTGGSGDVLHSNDTCVSRVELYNYFAYDDGTAESGFTIHSNSPSPKIYFACGFNVIRPDTLRSIRIWFNPLHDEDPENAFTLMVWNDNNGLPGTVLASQLATVQHAASFTDFANYYLDNPIIVSGKFYVGFLQTRSRQLNLGFDQNSDARNNFFYKIANNWETSFLKGAPMIRPVVGKYFDPIMDITPPIVASTGFTVYPNPAVDFVYIDMPNQNAMPITAEVYNMYGQRILHQVLSTMPDRLSLSDCQPGVYLCRLWQNGKYLGQAKIVKMR